MAEIKYVKSDTVNLYRAETDPANKRSAEYRRRIKIQLLWGDRVKVLETGGSRLKVRARGITGWVPKSALGNKSLLEFYFIDVGQGDGVLIRTPDHRHILIDGGWTRSDQPLGKNAADFVDWKFKRDYGQNKIKLDAMICSHNDQDHYGGLWDLLNPKQAQELRVSGVTIEAFYHAGLSWWKRGSRRTLGPWKNTAKGKMFTRLIDDRQSLDDGLDNAATPALQGDWANFLRVFRDNAITRDNNPTPMQRLGAPEPQSGSVEYLPGFEPQNCPASFRILGPVDFDVNGKPAIRRFPDGDSKNTNGNSVLLRVDYGEARILLTGDLNFHSQTSLLADYDGMHGEFLCDVAKACHHGSEDVCFDFLLAMHPTATVISSGDSEGHDHPRPNIVAASGLSGHQTYDAEGKLKTPLVYSTELARAVKVQDINKLEEIDASGAVIKTYKRSRLDDLRVTLKGKNRRKDLRLDQRKLAASVVYGLINVRTDGDTILCAALNELTSRWNVQTFKARGTGGASLACCLNSIKRVCQA